MHPQHPTPDREQALQGHMAAFYDDAAPHDNPWTGGAAEELQQGCKYCNAGPHELHDPHCPVNHSDNPEQDWKALGQRPPMSADPFMIHLNSVQYTLDWVDSLIR
jgi:hypothetical protein